MTAPRWPGVSLAFLLATISVPAVAQSTGQASDARKVVELIYPPGSYASTYRAAMQEFMRAQGGAADAERMRAAAKLIDDQAAKLGQAQEPIVREQMIKVAAARFSAADLVTIRTFLESPAGQAYSKHLPEITAALETPEQKAAMMVATAELSEKLEAADR